MKNYLLLLFGIVLIGCQGQTRNEMQEASKTETNFTDNTPKNIILLIGDGMGLSQVSAGFYFNEETSNFTRFNDIGLIRTSSSAQLVTDSAAGATAFASGVKTYNGAVGFSNKNQPVPTIVEIPIQSEPILLQPLPMTLHRPPNQDSSLL